MIILGVNSSHNATACLLKDGKIIACISEERLTRVKNQAGLPVLAIQECLRIAGLQEADIDYLVFNFLDPKSNLGFYLHKTERGKITTDKGLNFKDKITTTLWSLKERTLTNIPNSRFVIDNILNNFYTYFVDPQLKQQLYKQIESKLSIPKAKVVNSEHHNAHGYAAYYSSPFPKTKPILIFTLDSSGDGVCATVSIAKGDNIKRIATTKSGSSISDLYLATTTYLGMKPVEHEHKVMGLAAYSEAKHYQSALNKIRPLVWVNSDLTFGTKIHSHMFYQLLPSLFAYERFDNVAAAVQILTEERVCNWIKLAINKTGIYDLVCGGGTFMNVKVNQRIANLKEVKNLFIMPSAADESTAIGAAYWAHKKLNWKKTALSEIQKLDDLYLGRDFTSEEIQQALQKNKSKQFISKPKNINTVVASLLAKGQIVARFAGRSEWGARALGNRSILAHPAKLEVIPEINKQIKSRDFWMPFAPSILEEDQNEYFINTKKISTPYMMITFDSTEKGKQCLGSALHQYDSTLRPQVVYQKWNPDYFQLIKEFKKLTGTGGLLNTSFNLHGYPIVYSPEDALIVFHNSGLKYLALGPYLISKHK